MSFKNYTVIVTGGTRGIGKAIVQAFLAEEANVHAIYKGNDEAAKQFEASVEKGTLTTHKLDVANYDEVEQFFKQFNEREDRLDVLVNNAGIRRDAIVGMMTPNDWTSVIDTNLTGTFNMSKFAVMKMMSNRFGRIINITSPSGVLGFEGQANYASAKAGQVAFAKSLSKETAKRKITVNCVSPGFIDTDLLADLSDDLKKVYKNTVPMKRFGTTEEVAHAVLFLSSDKAAYITGSTIDVTGGL